MIVGAHDRVASCFIWARYYQKLPAACLILQKRPTASDTHYKKIYRGSSVYNPGVLISRKDNCRAFELKTSNKPWFLVKPRHHKAVLHTTSHGT